MPDKHRDGDGRKRAGFEDRCVIWPHAAVAGYRSKGASSSHLVETFSAYWDIRVRVITSWLGGNSINDYD